MKTDKMIARIIESFDWKRVSATMKALKWKWLLPNGNYKRPSIDDMKVFATNALRSVAGAPNIESISSGGFKAKSTRI